MAVSALLFGQISLKHSSMAEASEEQIQFKSFKPEHLDCFSTLATHANKQAGGVAPKVVCKVETIANKVEIFKKEAMVCSEWV
jgi:hypothetical protein